MQMFMVGGAVRDELLDVPSKDIDFTVVLDENDFPLATDFFGNPDPFKTMVLNLQGMGFNIFLESPEFLTVRAQFPKGDASSLPANMVVYSLMNLTADFVLARKEGTYSDGRRPDSVQIGTLRDDLARRDFTMNAVAKAHDGSYIDPFNGRSDIERRIIRAVGDPIERLREDALRAVRAFRFAVTKDFTIEDSLAHAMVHPEILAAVMNNISDERIEVELSKAFRFNTVRAGNILFRGFPTLATACFSGRVSLDATLKTKGRGK